MGDEGLEGLAAGVLRLLDDCGLDEEEIDWVTRRREARLVLALEPRGAGGEQAWREFEALPPDARHAVLRLADRLHRLRSAPV